MKKKNKREEDECRKEYQKGEGKKYMSERGRINGKRNRKGKRMR